MKTANTPVKKIKYFVPVTLFATERLRIESTHNESCNMCGWRESAADALVNVKVFKIIYSNTDDMHQTTSVNLCESHIRIMRTAFGVALDLKNLIK